MSCFPTLTLETIQSVFQDEIVARGGRVTETIGDDERLFARSVLPEIAPVAPGDNVQPGVALRVAYREKCVYPYVFRQVCRNGAIMAQTLGAYRFDDACADDPDEAVDELRRAVNACCEPGVFLDNVNRMRMAMASSVDLALTLLPMASRLGGQGMEVLSAIMKRFARGGDHSRFGLMNAATSLARDTRDPETRWNLEELGGGIAVMAAPVSPTGLDAAWRPTRDEWDEPVGAR